MKLQVVGRYIVLFLLVSAIPASGQQISAAPGSYSMPLRVFDSTGRFVSGVDAGSFAPGFPYIRITLVYQPTADTRGQTFSLGLQVTTIGGRIRYRWSEDSSTRFFFESTDCSGPPYAEAPGPVPGHRLALLDYETNVLYLSEPDPILVPRTYHSFRYPQQACVGNAGPGVIPAVSVEPIVDMTTVFTLPFRLQ